MKKIFLLLLATLFVACSPEKEEEPKCNCTEVQQIRYRTIVNNVWDNPNWQNTGTNKPSEVTNCTFNNSVISFKAIPTGNGTSTETRTVLICQ